MTQTPTRRGTVYRRCTGCGLTLKTGVRRCGKCGDTRNSWAYKVDLAPRGATKRLLRGKNGFADKASALAAMHARIAQADAERDAAPEPGTFGDYLRAWLIGRGRFTPKGQPLAPGSYDARRLHVEGYVLPHPIASVQLRTLTEDDLAAFYAHLATAGRRRKRRDGNRGLEAKTVFNVHRTIHRALVDAVKVKAIDRNPASDVPGMGKPDQATARHWTALELQRFYESTVEDRWSTLWRLAGSTGMRRGELAGLRWSDIDFTSGRIALYSQFAKGAGTVTRQKLKNKRGRNIALDAETVAALRELRKRQTREQERWHGRWGNDEALVFTHEDGSALHPDSVTKMFARRVKVAGLPPLTPHGLRHSHITHALEAGEHIKAVSQRAGHSSVAITGDVYAHVTPQMDASLASKVAAYVAAQAALVEGASS